MTLYDALVKFLSKKSESIEAPERVCPNCWGNQEYAGRFLEAVESAKIDLNNVTEKKGWIQAHAAKHFDGITSKTIDDHYACPSCKVKY